MDLAPAELRCLELAWEAWGRDTVPVGAVVTGAADDVLFEGRSTMYDRLAPSGGLANSLLAHAEINALARLDPRQRYETLCITTSLEPCPLCLGAIGMATIGRLTYLGRDPYGGAVGLHQPTRHLQRVPLQVVGPRRVPPGAGGRRGRP
jgi:tRNA(Arg) A34 adenosine deaminase TadA